MKMIQVRDIPDDDYRTLRITAAEHDMTVAAFLRWIIADVVVKSRQEKAAS